MDNCAYGSDLWEMVYFVFFFSFNLLLFVSVRNRCGESACTAYVTFKDAHALETAVLLSVSLNCKRPLVLPFPS